MTVTVYVTEISGIFCECSIHMSIKKDFILILNFILSSWKGSVVSEIIYVKV
jgi:hypothetical protein